MCGSVDVYIKWGWFMNNYTYVTFGVYFIFMIAIGVYFYSHSKKLDDYLLGGRGMGSWVTALSAEASDMSSWLLMGLPGAVYLFGLGQSWIAVGLIIGTFLNWQFVAAPLRLYTAETRSLTMSSFLGKRFKDPTNFIRIISSAITLFFFTVYASAGLVGAGKLFESMFNIDYKLAVIVGMLVMVIYTLLGGFLAVCWTDLFQALLMIFAVMIVPFIAFSHIDPVMMKEAFAMKPGAFDFLPQGTIGVAILGIISTASWGLGYFGQPHILVRFMSVRSIKLLPRAKTIAMVWVIISLVCSVAIGMLAIPLYPGLSDGNQEKVLIYIVRDFVPAYFSGIVLAAILAAIMSTVASQLLVSSSTLTEDVYAHLIRKYKASGREMMLISRTFVVLISVVALVLSLDVSSNIFNLVTFAWGGFGAAFGPVVLMALYSKKTTWYSALARMITGTVVMLVWYYLGFGKYMYEIVPGFLANFAVMFSINFFKPNEDKMMNATFDKVSANLKAGRTPGVD